VTVPLSQDTDVAVAMRKRCWRESIVWNLKFSSGVEFGDRGGSVMDDGIKGIWPAVEITEMFDSVSGEEGMLMEIAWE
jgi:hypothetical protein